jgi:hypothetical protein
MSTTLPARSTARSSSFLGTSIFGASSALRVHLMKAFGAIGCVVGAVLGLVILKVVGLIVVGLVGAVAGVFVGSATAASFSRRALDIVRSSVTAFEAEPAEEPRLFNLVESLSVVAGVSMPRVSVTAPEASPSGAMNVMVLVDPAGASDAEIVVTADLARGMSRIALEGVVATSMARIKSGHLEAQVEAAALTIEGPWFVTKRVRERIFHEANAAVDMFDIDVRACGYTRFPPGLAEAYEAMDAATTVTSAAPESCDSLWLASPQPTNGSRNDATAATSGSTVGQRDGERVTLAERIALLREI